MKKYNTPELKVVNLNIQSIMVAASQYEGDNPIPVITPQEAAKENILDGLFD